MQKDGEMLRKKRGQITIFIIVAIVIVVIALLIFFLYPRISGFFQEVNPQQFMQSCISQDVKENIELVSSQGGVIEPQQYILYQSVKIEYLCYTTEYYLLCVTQKPLLQRSIEQEIAAVLEPKARECFNELKSNLETRGYNVQLRQGDVLVELLPGKVRVDMNTTLTLSKESTATIKGFQVVEKNNLYDLVAIATSILNWEARYGDAESTIYMAYYPNIKVEKLILGEGSTIYTISDRNTGDVFRFASRSLVLPPGYAPGLIPEQGAA